MEVVFHIGTNKTGTSAIQGFLSSNPDYLRNHGWVYPLAGRTPRPEHGPLAHTPPELLPQLLPQLVSEIEKEAQDCGRVIISSEFLHTIDPSAILDAFSAHDIRTVAFLRDHASYLSSWYREAIKSDDKTYSFWDFTTLIKAPYYTWLSLWPNLSVVHYNRKELINHSAVDHFLHTLDPFLPLPQSSYEYNPSISGNLLLAKQIYNNFITKEQMHAFRAELPYFARINPTFSGQMQLSERELSYISDTYAYDREFIFDHYGVSLSPAPDSTQGNPTPNLETLSSDIQQIIDFSYENDLEFGKQLSKVFFVQK
jgi:hypothetical protein